MDVPLTRRRLLRAGGTGSALALAGCTAPVSERVDGAQGSGDGETQTGDGDGGGDADRLPVTLLLGFDREAFQERQQELQEAVSNGETDPEDAQSQLREFQRQLLTESVETFEGRIGDDDRISVVESSVEAGVLLIEGEPTALVGSLAFDEVNALLEAAEFDSL